MAHRSAVLFFIRLSFLILDFIFTSLSILYMIVDFNVYELSSTDSLFIVSQLISVAKHVRCFKLGSKPSWIYTSQISYCTAART